MQQNKRHLTQEAFLLSTFVEFNKCWISGKRSRLFIETVNGNAFMNFSVFLGHPGKPHFAPKNPQPPKKVKSKRKADRDNERAARFQERKRKEMEAAAAAAASEPSDLPQSTSSPATTQTSSSPEFSFAEPAQENISSDTSRVSDFATMNIDGNVTIPSKAFENSASKPLLVKVQCPLQGGCDAQTQTDKMVILEDHFQWIEYTEWFKANKHKVQPGAKQHAVQFSVNDERDSVDRFITRHTGRGVSESEIKKLFRSNHSEDQVLLEEYREFQESIARSRFDTFWQQCDNPRGDFESHVVPFDQPLTTFDSREPCNSPNFDGCICPGKGSWSDSE